MYLNDVFFSMSIWWICLCGWWYGSDDSSTWWWWCSHYN